MRPSLPLVLAAVVLVVAASAAAAQSEEGAPATATAADGADEADAATEEVLVVATKEAPPFVFRDEDGAWRGISITLWERVADELDLEWRFEEASLADMIDGVADGRFDASVAAMTITPERERAVDFSHPFYTTGFGIAVAADAGGWMPMLRGLVSPEFIKAILALVALLGFVGLFFWLAERRHNPEEFRPRPLEGLSDGFWFSAVTMTTVGYGDKAPRTAAGRLVALIWMFAALLMISTFTGMIASSLTANRLGSLVRGPQDLPDVTVATVTGSASDDWLDANGIGFEGAADVRAGLAAVAAGDHDAFVYDRPLLRYLATAEFDGEIEVLEASFGRQDYGIALPSGSALREPLNRALLLVLDSAAWERVLTRYLGRGD